MDADLDTLSVALYARIDDTLKDRPDCCRGDRRSGSHRSCPTPNCWGTSETEEDHLERLRRKNKKKQWRRLRVREREWERLTGKIVSTKHAAHDEGETVSAWLSAAAAARIRNRLLGEAIAETASELDSFDDEAIEALTIAARSRSVFTDSATAG